MQYFLLIGLLISASFAQLAEAQVCVDKAGNVKYTTKDACPKGASILNASVLVQGSTGGVGPGAYAATISLPGSIVRTIYIREGATTSSPMTVRYGCGTGGALSNQFELNGKPANTYDVAARIMASQVPRTSSSWNANSVSNDGSLVKTDLVSHQFVGGVADNLAISTIPASGANTVEMADFVITSTTAPYSATVTVAATITPPGTTTPGSCTVSFTGSGVKSD